MKKFFLAAAMLCGVVASAESDVDYAVLYWQIGGDPDPKAGVGAEKAYAGRLYWKESAASEEKTYIGGYSTAEGAGTGVKVETDLVGAASQLGDRALAGVYFFELLSHDTIDASTGDWVDSVYTSYAWTYQDFRDAGALREGFKDVSKPEVTRTGVATAYTVVPEPSCGLLLMMGAAALALRRRRRA